MKKLFLLIICSIVAKGVLYAQAGTLDNTFDTDGKVITGNYIDAKLMVIQNDNRIVVGAGYGNLVSIIRYNTDGSLDTNFGSGGVAEFSLSADKEFLPKGMIIQNNQWILISGVMRRDTSPGDKLVIFRFNLSDGSIDNTFGTNGMAENDKLYYSYGVCGTADDNKYRVYNGGQLTIQPNGNIIQVGTVVAYCNNQSLPSMSCLWRYSSNGILDTITSIAFTAGGYALSATTTAAYMYNDTVAWTIGYGPFTGIDSENIVPKLMMFGLYSGTTNFDIPASISEFDPLTKDFLAYFLAKQSDGYLIGGAANDGIKSRFVVAKIAYPLTRQTSFLKYDLDSTFGTNGVSVIAVGTGNSVATAVAVLPNDKILLGGHVDGIGGDFALVRLNANGTLDNTFGTNGKVITDISSSDDYSLALGLQSDGKIVLAGQSIIGLSGTTVVARYNNDITLGVEDDVAYNTDAILYPNPATNQLSIKLEGEQVEQVSIYNISGQLLLNIKQPLNNKIDISPLAAGFYLAEIKTNAGMVKKRWAKM